MKLDAGLEVEADPELCSGGGMGAIVMACIPILRNEVSASFAATGDMNTDILNEGGAFSNEFSITWSYTTSDNPAK